jgi:hypothetical protein
VLHLPEEVTGRARLDQLPGVHHHDAIGAFRDNAKVVRDQQNGHIEPLAEVVQEIQDLLLDRDIKRGRWLVGDQQPRVAGQRHRDDHALPEPAG